MRVGASIAAASIARSPSSASLATCDRLAAAAWAADPRSAISPDRRGSSSIAIGARLPVGCAAGSLDESNASSSAGCRRSIGGRRRHRRDRSTACGSRRGPRPRPARRAAASRRSRAASAPRLGSARAPAARCIGGTARRRRAARRTRRRSRRRPARVDGHAAACPRRRGVGRTRRSPVLADGLVEHHVAARQRDLVDLDRDVEIVVVGAASPSPIRLSILPSSSSVEHRPLVEVLVGVDLEAAVLREALGRHRRGHQHDRHLRERALLALLEHLEAGLVGLVDRDDRSAPARRRASASALSASGSATMSKR